MITIGIDGNEANVEKKVGVSFYTLNLLRWFKKFANKNLRFIIYLKNKPNNDLPLENNFFKYKIIPGNFLWTQIFLPLNLYKNKNIDIFFSPAHYLPRFSPVKTVVTIHDLSFLYFPKDFLLKDLYQLKFWTKYSIKKANKIIAVSKTTKKDIIKNYHIPERKIEVIYNGFEKTSTIKTKKFTLKIQNKPYILYVGTIQPRKNIDVLIEAFSKFKLLYPNNQLIIAGKKGWLYKDIFQKVINLGLEDSVFFTDYVSENQLIFLYKNAFCLVMPSLYEGFGLPILEAMNFDCPVISSYSSSLPEIAGDAAIYFDPKNPLDLVEKLKLLKENLKLKKDLIKKGKNKIKEFSWKKTAEQTLNLIINTLKDN